MSLNMRVPSQTIALHVQSAQAILTDSHLQELGEMSDMQHKFVHVRLRASQAASKSLPALNSRRPMANFSFSKRAEQTLKK